MATQVDEHHGDAAGPGGYTDGPCGGTAHT